MARLEGFEPPAISFEGCRSIHLSYRRSMWSLLTQSNIAVQVRQGRSARAH